jgi:small subunit ribosomal protein S13
LAEEEQSDFRFIVRIANTDLDGAKSVVTALPGIKGIGKRLAEIVCDRTNVSRKDKIGDLSEEQTDEIEKVVEEMSEDIPTWLFNRKKDYDSGEDIHIIGPELDMTRRGDVNRMKMIRCYKGIRHERGHKVRGQRTRSNGRKGLTVGVRRKAVIRQQGK